MLFKINNIISTEIEMESEKWNCYDLYDAVRDTNDCVKWAAQRRLIYNEYACIKYADFCVIYLY